MPMRYEGGSREWFARRRGDAEEEGVQARYARTVIAGAGMRYGRSLPDRDWPAGAMTAATLLLRVSAPPREPFFLLSGRVVTAVMGRL
ncbi:hypothetical protein [Sphingomonas sp. CFBP 8760]|uniref:hypothetical protein n=1 Tax=Sphingomonas sp. CFBP 8760 TaxID=2775282 RepID=UPI0017836948|nr:hypothetical protein [Sphingomonas sp. CFBP 8760]MBD8547217.1 hypothetical protein [Sphingomonas sp. CFBP 8760]